MSKKRQKAKKSKTLSRIITLVLGLGFAGSTIAIALSSVFSQNSPTVSNSNTDTVSLEEQIQLQIDGYEKVLEREPENVTALEGLAQIYIQTEDPKQAIPTLEKLVKYYPEQPEYADILDLIKQQEIEPAKTKPPEATPQPE
jgi:tetratricopeptide (TPR) repeat protein